jgi:phosphoribosylformylglycinamidine synthase PurS subunit
MKFGIRIMPKREVLDSQGRAVERTLKNHGRALAGCRVGRYVELDIEEADETKAKAKAREICEFILHNPLIETYEIEKVG